MLTILLFQSALAGAVCQDGWVSSSSGSGTCSHHGGVSVWTTNYSPPAAATRSVYSSPSAGWSTPSPALDARSEPAHPSVYSTVGVDGASISSAGPEPLDLDYIRTKLKGFPGVGTIAVVVSEGDSCVVGVYEPMAAGTRFFLATLNMYKCQEALDPGDVVEVLADQMLMTPTANTDIYSLKQVTSATDLSVRLSSPPVPVSYEWIESRLAGFPKAGHIAVVVSRGDSCIVGLFGGSRSGPSYSLARLNMYKCGDNLRVGQVVEILGDQMLVSATQNLDIYSITSVSGAVLLKNPPAWATH